MVDLNRQIRATQARQGGFSAHVLPGPVGYEPFSNWGMGWLFTDDPLVNGAHDVTTVTGISGDGSASVSFTVDSGGAPFPRFNTPQSMVLPVYRDTFIVVFFWNILTNHTTSGDKNFGDENELINPTTITETDGATVKQGYGKKGLVLSKTSAQQITIPESLASLVASLFSNSEPDSSFTFDSDITFMIPRTVVSSGSRYGDALPPGGGNWRIPANANSGFARAFDEDPAPATIAQPGGSMSAKWYPNYSDWNDVPYLLEREASPSSDQWQLWADGVSIVDSPVSITPVWTQETSGPLTNQSFFWPLISIPFTDRRQFFEDEHSLIIS
jgi:hypothetical protein